VACDAAGWIDGADVAVDAGVAVGALVDNGGTEGVADLRVDAGKGVVETDAEGYVLRDGEGLRKCKRGERNDREKQKDGDFGRAMLARRESIQRRHLSRFEDEGPVGMA
jgi:hypothetical protein